MIKKLNRRGFTLVELLAVIAIITLVLGLTSYGVIEILNNSKGSTSKISQDGIVEAAKVYGTEKINDDSYWKEKDGDDNKYFCVTIEELFNKGLLKKDSKLPNDIVKTDYVAIKKNSVTSVIGNGTILDSDENNVCTGTVLKEKLNFPSMSLGNIFSDEINVNFSDVTSDSGAVSINKTECLYGDSSGKMTSDNSSIDGHKCSISKLKSGEYYYVRICQTTLKGSYVCSKTEGIKTKKIESPKIDISDTGINIKYSSEVIQNGKAIFSFKSTIDSETNIEVIDSNGSKTKNIVKNEWYKTNQENVFLKYSNKGNGFIYVRTSDGINIEEVKGKFTVHEVIFDRGNADKIGGGTDNITLYCVAKYSSECKIKSPTIEKNNYDVVGWNISRDATSDSTDNWKVGTEKKLVQI